MNRSTFISQVQRIERALRTRDSIADDTDMVSIYWDMCKFLSDDTMKRIADNIVAGEEYFPKPKVFKKYVREASPSVEAGGLPGPGSLAGDAALHHQCCMVWRTDDSFKVCAKPLQGDDTYYCHEHDLIYKNNMRRFYGDSYKPGQKLAGPPKSKNEPVIVDDDLPF